MNKRIVTVLSVGISLFHILSTVRNIPLDAYIMRSIHLTVLLVIIFLSIPLRKNNKLSAVDVILACMIIFSGLYVTFNYSSIRLQAGLPEGFQVILSIMLIIAIMEGTRRTSGLALPTLATVSLLYAFFGNLIPGRWGHPGYSISRVTGYLYLTTDGVWGMPIGVSATVLIIFVIFGAFLQKAKIEKVFTDLSMAIAGRTVGGPGQVAVISSALLGTVSGSAVANVVATGSFTIPLMKRRGYEPHFAGAVEAVASTGGQIMPPIMGAGAFIMAEMLELPYISIVVAAIVPAVLYFASAFLSVHFEAKRIGLTVPKEQDIPKLMQVIKKQGYMLLPLVSMIVVISKGYSAAIAALTGIFLTIVVSMFNKDNRLNLIRIKEALGEGASGVLSVASACGCAGIVLGVVSMTGLGTKLTTLITRTADGNLAIALFLAMCGAIILGMGLPTGVAYVIAAASTGPALIQMGMQPLVAHMFIFYFAILGTITPPVCLSVYTAAGLAGSGWVQTAFTAIKIAIPGFIVPYVFSNNPALLMQGQLLEIIRVSFTAFIGVLLLSAGAMGYMFQHVNKWERTVLVMAALSLIITGTLTDIIGLVLGGLVVCSQWRKDKQMRKGIA